MDLRKGERESIQRPTIAQVTLTGLIAVPSLATLAGPRPARYLYD